MGPTRCPETSVKDYHSTLRYTPEKRSSREYFWFVILILEDLDERLQDFKFKETEFFFSLEL
jgi:hypothetical protein